MTQQIIGFAADVQNNLPAPVNIATTTSGTPITVTTSAPHGIRVGEYFNVSGATDAPTNGNWLAGSGTTGSTLKLTVIPGGGNSTSAGSGGAAGTVLSLGFGVTTPILVDGDAPSAALWNVPYEAVLDQCAYLLYITGPRRSFVSVQEGSMFVFGVGPITFESDVEKTKTVYQNLLMPHGATVTAIDFRIAPANHAAISGLTLPVITFTKYDAISGSNTTIATASDASVNAVAYSLPHDLTVSSFTEIIDRQKYFYRLSIETETGGINAMDGTAVFTARVTMNTTTGWIV